MNITLIKGDITRINVGAIVNAANSSLLGGGGVDGAIHRAGGPSILKECKQIRNRQGGCHPGKAVITSAGNLPCQKVIHTVGPVWNGGTSNEAFLLASCYTNSLNLAEHYQIESKAYPNISTGIYGFPKEKAATIAIDTVRSFKSEIIKEVIFVCFDEENYRIYQDKLDN